MKARARTLAAAVAHRPLVVNDIHSALNATEIRDVVVPDSLAGVLAAVGRARETGVPLSVAGGRHAMGGQQPCSGEVLLDTRALARLLAFDRAAGTIEVEAGMQWPALQAFISQGQNGARRRWGIAQKETGAGADPLSLGGALAAKLERVVELRSVNGLEDAFLVACLAVLTLGAQTKEARSRGPRSVPAATYSPGRFPSEYHRRWRA